MSMTMDIQQYLQKEEMHFLHIDLHSAYVNILVGKDGHANYEILRTDTTGTDALHPDSSSFYLDIERVVMKKGRLRYKDKQNGISLTMEGIDHRAKWEINKAVFDWETHTKVDRFTLDHAGVRYLHKKETEIDMVLQVDNHRALYTFKENNIRINHFNFGLEGDLGLTSKGYKVNLRFAAKETLFKHLLSLLPGVYMEDLKQIKTNGDVAFDGYVKGIYNDSTGLLPAYHVNMKVKNAMFKYDSLPVPVENIQFHLIADNKDGHVDHTVINLKSFKLTMDDNTVDGHMLIEGLRNSRVEGEMKASIDLADMNKIYPIKDLSMAGLINIDLKTAGVYDRRAGKFPSLDASLSVSDGFLMTTSYPEPLEEIHFSAEVENTTGKMADTKAQINKCTFMLEHEPFDLKGSVYDFNKYVYDFVVKGKLDLAKITQLYPLAGMSLQGIVNIDVESKGSILDLENKNYEQISTEGKVEITDFLATYNQLPKPVRIDKALFSFTPSSIILENWAGRLGDSKVKMKGEMLHYLSFLTHKDDMMVGDLKLECDTLNLNEWLTVDSARSGSDSTRKMTVVEVPENVDFTFDSDIKCLRYQDMHMTDLVGEIRIKNKVLTLQETGFNSLGAKFNITGAYNTVDRRNVFFDVNLRIQELDINKAYREVGLVRNLAPVCKDAFGTLSIEYKFKANLDENMHLVLETMEGKGHVRIHEAKIEGMKIMNEISRQARKSKLKDPTLQDLLIDTEIHGTKLLVKPFTLKFSDFDAQIEGVSELSGKLDYHVRVSLLPFEKIRLPFHITGTYDKPKIALGKGKPIEQ